ncbi:MAG: protein of unknown function [Nitrospira sp.]
MSALLARVRLPASIQAIVLLLLAGCSTTSLDMSNQPVEPPGPGWGVVVGSVLVEAEDDPPDSWWNRTFGRNAEGFTYEFQIVKVELTDPNGTSHPYAQQYRLDAKPRVERMFVARLPVGSYLIKTFRHEGLSAIGGDLDVRFSVEAGRTQYLGRLVLDVPRRVSFGAPYTFRIVDERATAIAAIRQRQPALAEEVVNRPMQVR